jgi:hypothetical protein
MKETHQGPLYYNSRRFCQGYNKKFYNPVCSVIELLSTYSFFTEGKTHIILDTLFLRDAILTPFVVKNVVYITISFFFVFKSSRLCSVKFIIKSDLENHLSSNQVFRPVFQRWILIFFFFFFLGNLQHLVYVWCMR